MEEKKIIVEIDNKGNLKAETFGMQGTECLDELDKLLKDIARNGTTIKKREFYEQKTTLNNKVSNKNGQLL
mgnify:CR=1 FL=1